MMEGVLNLFKSIFKPIFNFPRTEENFTGKLLFKNENRVGTMTELVHHKESKPAISLLNQYKSVSALQSIFPKWIQSTGRVKDKKLLGLFTPDELRNALMPTLYILYHQNPESLPFRQPIDSQGPEFQDYYDVIKNPMDLSTIKEKLELGLYSDPWDYVDDVWTMFNNAWLYNPKKSRVYKYCTTLSEIFVKAIDPVMQALGYCCGRKYTFNPQILCCYGKQLCTIQNDDKYYTYQNRYNFCQQCFNDLPGDSVTIKSDSTKYEILITKDQFQEMKNDDSESETFVYCNDCGRKWHQICVLPTKLVHWSHGFTCNNCLSKQYQESQRIFSDF